MVSPQTLSESDRRLVAAWAAVCAEHVFGLVESTTAAAATRDALERTRAYSRAELDTAGEIRRRFAAFPTDAALCPASTAAARSAAQAAAVAHMGAHALGAAAYAVRAAELFLPGSPGAREEEIAWQLEHLSDDARVALRQLPRVRENPNGPLGKGLLASGALGEIVRVIQSRL